MLCSPCKELNHSYYKARNALLGKKKNPVETGNKRISSVRNIYEFEITVIKVLLACENDLVALKNVR